MKCFNRFRAKDPILAAIISMGMMMSAQAIAAAQSNDWEEVGPASLSAQQQLMSAPPQIAANVSGQVSYRPPVAVPVVNSAIQSEYVVQTGDTLPKIAMKVYGDPNRWQDLMVLNNIDNGNRIYVGQKLVTLANSKVVAEDSPIVNENEVAEMPEESESADASFYGSSLGDSDTYTVKKGDTMGRIAKNCLGSTAKWKLIAKANPNINPNRLKVGDVLVIPGTGKANKAVDFTYDNDDIAAIPQPAAAPVANRTASAQPWQMAAANVEDTASTAAYDNYAYAQNASIEPPTVSAPSFDPNTAPLVAPPPPPAGMYGSYSSPSAPYSPPSVYSSDAIAPPPAMPSTTPDIPYIAPSSNVASPVISASPVAVSSRNLYREEKYRLPDELKTTDFDPYFTNFNGYRGLFNTESALIPYLPTWNVAFNFKYEDLKYLNGKKNVIDGDRSLSNFHLNYTGHKLFVGITVPYQTWHEKPASGGPKSELNAMHDSSLKFGYQVWKNLEGTHAVTLHIDGKFSSGNYHRAILGTGLKTKDNAAMGPAGATKGSWVEMGCAYSGKMSDRWSNHLNIGVANDSTDDITKLIIRAGTDYRVNRNFALVGEIEANSYEAPTAVFGQDGTNAELTLGMVVFNDSWQGIIGFPMTIKQDWGTQSSFGVIAGVSHRWD